MRCQALICFKRKRFHCWTGGRQQLRLIYCREVCWNHKKNNVIFLLGSPRQSYSVYEKKARASSVSQRSHSATYTHLSHTALCTICNRTCTLAQERTRPILQRAQPTQVTLSRLSLTRTHLCTSVFIRTFRGKMYWPALYPNLIHPN